MFGVFVNYSRFLVVILTFTAASPAFAQKAKKPDGGATEPPPPPIRYAVTWLDAPRADGDRYHLSQVSDINRHGDVVGTLVTLSVPNPGFGWISTMETGSIPFDLNRVALPPEEGEHLFIRNCYAINNNREIVGRCEYKAWSAVGFRLQLPVDENGLLIVDPESALPIPTQVEVLPPPMEAIECSATDINDAGDIVIVAGGTWLYTAEGLRISGPAVRNIGFPRLSNTAQVVGTYEGSDAKHFGYRWSPNLSSGDSGSWTVISSFVAPHQQDRIVSTSKEINDSGLFIGQALYRATRFSKSGAIQSMPLHHAYVHDGTTMFDLGVLPGFTSSEANGVNSVGDVVGACTTNGSDPSTGFLWTPQHGTLDLKQLVIADNRWASATRVVPSRLSDPLSAGGFGSIVGHASIGSENHAFLLTPILP